MPLNPYFVQTVSEGEVKDSKIFTNRSSQQENPGMLGQIFNTKMQDMPFVHDDIPVPEKMMHDQINENNNVSQLPKIATMGRGFEDATVSKARRFRTGSMRMWGVPLGQTELRATEMNF